ncbi:hypothetical protein KP509_02G080300 [Ceratopteris richardii]|nr:hypothetical protein KP509_02G080300 [Ceratopteris richardii]
MSGNLHDACRIFSKILKPTVYTWTAIILAHYKLGKIDDVFQLYEKSWQEGIEPSKFVYSSILKLCCSMPSVKRGRSIHTDIVKIGMETDLLLTSMMIKMYLTFSSLDEATTVFTSSPCHDVVTWGTIITGYTQLGEGHQAIEMFIRMHDEGICPDEVIYSCILKACSTVTAVKHGKRIHSEVLQCGIETDIVVGNTLIDMYINFGELSEARYIFDSLLKRNLVAWGTMIAGYVQHEKHAEALVLFKELQSREIYCGRVPILFALKACCSIRRIADGHMLHKTILSHGYDTDVAVGSVLVEMYGKCERPTEAQCVFSSLPEKNVYSWNALITVYNGAGLGCQALIIYENMLEKGVEPDTATFSCALAACASLEALKEGMILHDQIFQLNFLSDAVIVSALLDMYAKCGDLKSAKKVFDTSQVKDSRMWSTLISNYAQHGHGLPALEAFVKMQREGLKANETTLASALKACSLIKEVTLGKIIHDQIVRSGFESGDFICNTLVGMYAKCGNLKEASKLFETLSNLDTVSWNAMIVGTVHHGHYQDAIDLFDKMQQKGLIPDRVTFSCILKACSGLGMINDGRLIHEKLVNDGFLPSMVVGSTLIDMYAKCGSLQEARDLFEHMPNRGLVSWGAMITGYAVQGNGFEAIKLYWKMVVEGLWPDQVILVSVLKACCSMGALRQVRLLHMEVINYQFDADLAIVTLLIHVYSKLGSLEDAQWLFHDMRATNIAVWNAIVGGYVQHGDWRQATQSLVDLQNEGMKPVGTTYTNVLAACSHGGQVEAAHQSLQAIREADNNRNSEMEHLNCLIDVLGRTGSLCEAGKMIWSMPATPSITTWMSLLAACKTYGQPDLGRACFDQLIRLDPCIAAGYTIMLDIYADAQRWEDLHAIQELKRSAGARKLPGKAWIEVNNEVFEFIVEDMHIATNARLIPMLKHMQALTKSEGYVPHLDLTFKNAKIEDE